MEKLKFDEFEEKGSSYSFYEEWLKNKSRFQKQLSKNTKKMSLIEKQKLSRNKYILLVKYFCFLFQKMPCTSLPFGLVRKEKTIKLDLPKKHRASQYIRRLPYIRNEDPNFKNSIIDIVNSRSDLRKILQATSDYGKKNIQEILTQLLLMEKFNQAVVRRALDQKNRGLFESPIPLSVTFTDAKKFDIQNPIIGNLLSQVNANKISHEKVKQLLDQAKNEKLQARIDTLRKRTDRSDDDDDDDDNNNINFNDSNDDDNVGGEELCWRYNNLRRTIIPSNDNNEEELFCRYNNPKAPLNPDEVILHRYSDIKTPLFRDILPSPPLPLKKPDIEKDYDDTFLPPQTPTVEALKTYFDCPLTNLLDKANNIIENGTKEQKTRS